MACRGKVASFTSSFAEIRLKLAESCALTLKGTQPKDDLQCAQLFQRVVNAQSKHSELAGSGLRTSSCLEISTKGP